MKPGNVRHLLRALHWLSRAIWWRRYNRSSITGIPVDNIAQLQAGWVKVDLKIWRAATFQ